MALEAIRVQRTPEGRRAVLVYTQVRMDHGSVIYSCAAIPMNDPLRRQKISTATWRALGAPRTLTLTLAAAPLGALRTPMFPDQDNPVTGELEDGHADR